MNRHPRLLALTLLASLVTASCGGGGDAAGAPPDAAAPTDAALAAAATVQPEALARRPAAPAAGTVTQTSAQMALQIAAASATAQTNPACAQSLLGDYYWEVGDANGPLVSGQVGSKFTATTAMSIASASKWIYASYVVEQHGGTVPAAEVPFLNFTSGYTNFGAVGRCMPSDTVASCVARNNATQDPATIGRFDYDSGHMEVHANSYLPLGADGTTALNGAILGPLFKVTSLATLGYSSPLMAAGVYTSASNYGAFLRRILSGALLMKGQLGSSKVCTNPTTCSTARFSPMMSSGESWNYSLGHWVEDDPVVGDHAFSSAGAGGFYPWIDQSKTYYGVLARQVNPPPGSFPGYTSAQCGRLIRQAFVTGVAVTSTTPTPVR